MGSAFNEIRSSLASLESMIDRAGKFVTEYDERIRDRPDARAEDIPMLDHAVSFPELRELDLLCKEALERHASEYPELAALAKRWYVHDNVGTDGPEDLRTDLVRKRAVLQQALNLVSQGAGSNAPDSHEALQGANPPKPSRPTLIGRIGVIPRWLGTVADVGGGIAIIFAVLHWVLGLL
jgi:hypothetical protein